MITVRNEFETVPAFENIAGCSLGTESARATAFEMIEALERVSSYDCKALYKDLASATDDDIDYLFDTQQEIADLLDEHMPMPEFCRVTLQDNEWLVLPSIESALEECESFEDYPEERRGDSILVVNDHGNVTCMQWDPSKNEYSTIWDMV